MTAAIATDSYGTRFCLLNDAADFRTDAFDDCQWDARRDVFRLLENQQPVMPQPALADAVNAWQNAQPMVQDHYGQLGYLSENHREFWFATGWAAYLAQQQGESSVEAGPVRMTSEAQSGDTIADVSLDAVTAPADTTYRDLALGGDGRAALPFSNGLDRHGVTVTQLSRRWQQTIALPFVPVRAEVDSLNRCWVAGNEQLALCEGEPLPQGYQPRNDRFEPLVINPHTLAIRWQQALPPNRTLMALACDDASLYLLTRLNGTQTQEIWQRPLLAEPDLPLQRWALAADLPLVSDIAVLSDHTLALMVPVPEGSTAMDAPIIQLQNGGVMQLMPWRYPLDGQRSVRFLGRALTHEAYYLSRTGPRQLVALPQAQFLTEGHAILNRTQDSGDYDTVWHRLYLDASIPPGCTLTLSVKAFNEFANEGSDWQQQGAPVRLAQASELAFHAGRLATESAHGGLYEVLLQREAGAVRDIRGRYLKLRIAMTGDGRQSPAISEMRVYYPRFSWQENYLPALFHQQQTLDPSDTGRANGADLRERLLASFEGMMTPIEERIVNAECWLYPDAVPEDALADLGNLLGAAPPAYWPVARKRAWIETTGWLQQRKGTVAGLAVALDIATDGAVRLGQVVPVENYRLRRTLATILGISLDDAEHPLTLGTGLSGNSIVGESLILSDEDAQDFLALFAPEVAAEHNAQEAVAKLFDRYAHRLSIVIHPEARAHRQSIQQISQAMVPGSVDTQFIETEHPFVLGLSPLLGIDTYLQQAGDYRRIILNDTALGFEGLIRNPAALSPANVHHRPEE